MERTRCHKSAPSSLPQPIWDKRSLMTTNTIVPYIVSESIVCCYAFVQTFQGHSKTHCDAASEDVFSMRVRGSVYFQASQSVQLNDFYLWSRSPDVHMMREKSHHVSSHFQPGPPLAPWSGNLTFVESANTSQNTKTAMGNKTIEPRTVGRFFDDGDKFSF